MKKTKCLLQPDRHYPSVETIDFGRLYEAGIRVLLTDLDNTLVPHGAAVPDAYAFRQLSRMRAAGIECVLFSNAKPRRLGRFREAFGVPCIPSPMKPARIGLRKAFRQYPGLTKSHFALLGDQLFTDIFTGRAGGIFTILVDPVSFAEPPFIRFKRRIEKPFKKGLSID